MNSNILYYYSELYNILLVFILYLKQIRFNRYKIENTGSRQFLVKSYQEKIDKP